jgi:hypothetical protein
MALMYPVARQAQKLAPQAEPARGADGKAYRRTVTS